MTKPTKITDMRAWIIVNLLWQFRDSERLVEVIGIFADEMESVEAIFHDLIDKRQLDQAVGVQLDQYGRIVQWLRAGASDDEFRAGIEIGIQINTTHGLAETTAYIVSQIVEVPVRYRQVGRAHFSLEFIRSTKLSQATIDLLNSIMPKIAPAGVSWEIIEGIDDGVDPAKQFDTTGAGFNEGRFARRIDVL